MTRHHRIHSADGTGLSVVDTGPQDGAPILLVHGWAQSHACWQRQLESPLATTHRLVALDLRGHGTSDAPETEQAYAGSEGWAADLHAILTTLSFDRPVLVGWSYGARVIAEYLDVHGDAAIAGVVLAGGIAATGAAREPWMLGPASPALNRDLYTDDPTRRLQATLAFQEACTATPLPRAQIAAFTAEAMRVSGLTRRAMFAADRDLRPIYARLGRPVLIIHGEKDAVVAPATGAALAAAIPQATYLPMQGAGHAPFLDAPERFNEALAEFTATARAAAPAPEPR
ncbi:alpha/beta fold hydrolase [Algicella marina]|nr:alpha/beta hydrolase [Algicella marina]